MLDTCGIVGGGPSCEEKWPLILYPDVDSFYARVQSSVGWRVLTPWSEDWFSNVRPFDTWPGSFGRDTFEFSQLNHKTYPAVYDSISRILSEFEVDARIMIRMGPYSSLPKNSFLYEFILSSNVPALQFLNRLKSWIQSDVSLTSYSASVTQDLIKATLTGISIHEELSWRCHYANQSLIVDHSAAVEGDLLIVDRLGSVVNHNQIARGHAIIDLSFLPTGAYYAVLGGVVFPFVKID